MLITAAFSFLVTPLVKRLSLLLNIIDAPNSRKIHVVAIPRIGGLAIYLSFMVGIILLKYLTDVFSNDMSMFWAITAGGTMITVLGLLDDKYDMKASNKLIGQIIAGLTVIYCGVSASHITNPFNGEMLELGWFSIPFTLVWIISITNSINLVDGLDGLAAGLSGIAALAISVIAFLSGNSLEGVLGILLFCAIIGFLFFNFYPANIFMGDTGSLFLGLILSVFTMQELKEITLFGIMVPLLLLAVPILDTLYAIIRRRSRSLPIFQPDKHHLHHQLLGRGMSHKKAVIAIYSLSVAFSILGILLFYVQSAILVLPIIILLIMFQFTARVIGVIDKKDKANKKRHH